MYWLSAQINASKDPYIIYINCTIEGGKIIKYASADVYDHSGRYAKFKLDEEFTFVECKTLSENLPLRDFDLEVFKRRAQEAYKRVLGTDES